MVDKTVINWGGIPSDLSLIIIWVLTLDWTRVVSSIVFSRTSRRQVVCGSSFDVCYALGTKKAITDAEV